MKEKGLEEIVLDGPEPATNQEVPEATLQDLQATVCIDE